MAIKLADVIENLNTSYPVVDTGKRGVYGFYNGAATDAIQPIELLFADNVKGAITADGSATTGINLTTLPYSTSTGIGLVTPDGDRVVLSQKGGIVTVLDSTLADNTDTVPTSPLTAAYLINSVVAGNVSSTNRFSVDALSELVQQFNRYTDIAPDEAYALSSSETEEFYIAGYDTERKVMRKMTLSTLIGYINADIVTTALSLGFISSSNAGSFGSVGAAFGDINGDGQVGTVDLLAMLGNYGASTPTSAFISSYTFMSGGDNSGFFSVTQAQPSANSNTEFIVGDFTTFNTPVNISFTNDTLNWTATSIANVGNPHYIKHEGFLISSSSAAIYQQQAFYVKFNGRVLFNADDTLYCLVYVKATFADATVSENIFHMNLEGGGIGSAGISPTNSSIEIGVETPVVLKYASVGTTQSVNQAFTPFYTTNTLLYGHTPNVLSGTEFLEDYEVRILFTSVTNNVQVRVDDVTIETKHSQ